MRRGAAGRSAAAGHGAAAALTAGFHAGFAVSAALVAVTIVIAAVFLGEDGRGERVNLVELQAGHQDAWRRRSPVNRYGRSSYLPWMAEAPLGGGTGKGEVAHARRY